MPKTYIHQQPAEEFVITFAPGEAPKHPSAEQAENFQVVEVACHATMTRTSLTVGRCKLSGYERQWWVWYQGKTFHTGFASSAKKAVEMALRDAWRYAGRQA
jgi:hypothetical protein